MRNFIISYIFNKYKIESWCSDVGCVMDQGSLSCGWYQLKYEYWLDCGQPGGGNLLENVLVLVDFSSS
jgi:hypothetical protein